MLTPLLLALLTTAPAQTGDVDRPELRAALEAAEWIRSTQVETEGGVVWPMDPDDEGTHVRHLYSGTPGVILFFIELHRATGDARWLADARRGGDDLMAWLATDPVNNDAGLWTGQAGQAFTLHQLHRASGEARFRDGAQRTLENLKNAGVPGPGGRGIVWSDSTDIVSGTAGTGLFLLYAAREMNDPDALGMAREAGAALVHAARPVTLDDDDGLDWPMTPDFPRLMPNFSHGTAGVAYFLATLYETPGAGAETRFRDAAVAGGRYLISIARTDDAGCLVHHHDPDGQDLFYLGWCHGPVGTARLFQRLASIDPGGGWSPWVERGARSIMKSGIPQERVPGFWENVGQCCGSAGVAKFFLELSTRHGPQDEHLAFAWRMHRDILTRGTPVELDGGRRGLKWVQAEHRVRPEFVVAQTGYMQGAAGIGLWLLEADARKTGRVFELTLPDAIPARPTPP